MNPTGVVIATMICLAAVPSAGSAFTLRQAPQVDLETVEPASAGTLQIPQLDVEGRKSTGRAILYSLALPGWGHRYLGRPGLARTFFVVEGAVWTSVVALEVQGRLREDGYEDYARQFAGISDTEHSDDFYGLLTDFNSSDDYEAQLRSEGRIEFFPGGDAQTLKAYYLSNRVGDFEPWVWQNEEARRFFQERRAASKRAFRHRTFALAAAIANRVAAAFFTLKASRDLESTRAEQRGYQLQIGAPGRGLGDEFQTGVSVIRRF